MKELTVDRSGLLAFAPTCGPRCFVARRAPFGRRDRGTGEFKPPATGRRLRAWLEMSAVPWPRSSGTASGGVLTVTDGTHTAQIKLIGDYFSSTFVAASDGHGGTIVIDYAAPAAAPAAQIFVAAVAGVGVETAGGRANAALRDWCANPPILARPAVMAA